MRQVPALCFVFLIPSHNEGNVSTLHFLWNDSETETTVEKPKYYVYYEDLNENHPSFFGNFYEDINIGFGEKFQPPTLPTFNHSNLQIFKPPSKIKTNSTGCVSHIWYVWKYHKLDG